MSNNVDFFECYRDSNNSPIPLPRLVREEPEWAVSMIRDYRRTIAELTETVNQMKERLYRAEEMLTQKWS